MLKAFPAALLDAVVCPLKAVYEAEGEQDPPSDLFTFYELLRATDEEPPE